MNTLEIFEVINTITMGAIIFVMLWFLYIDS